MNKNRIEQIEKEIMSLVRELSNLVGSQPVNNKPIAKKLNSKKGAAGALSILMDEKFFDRPRDITMIMEKLKEIGRYYPRSTVMMNLLNLTKRRILTRFKERDLKKWQYVVRK